MAGDRLIVGAALAACACDASRAAEAQPAPRDAAPPGEIQPAMRAAIPAGWVPLPSVAQAATDAASAKELRGVTLAAAAWGDPADGCYLLVADLRGARRDRLGVVVEKLGWHLDAQAAMHAWQTPTGQPDPAEITGELTVGSLSGRLRAVLSFDARSLPRAGLAACFYNEREPVACEQACAALLPHLQAPPVIP